MSFWPYGVSSIAREFSSNASGKCQENPDKVGRKSHQKIVSFNRNSCANQQAIYWLMHALSSRCDIISPICPFPSSCPQNLKIESFVLEPREKFCEHFAVDKTKPEMWRHAFYFSWWYFVLHYLSPSCVKTVIWEAIFSSIFSLFFMAGR